MIGATTVMLFVVCTYIALFHSKIGEASPGTPLLWPDHEFNVATEQIAERFGGVDSLVVYSDGDRPNASADADPIKAMERFERCAQGRHQPRRLDLGGAVPAHLLAGEPLRRSEVVLRAGPPGHRARRDLPAAAERRAGLHAPVHDRRRPQGQHRSSSIPTTRATRSCTPRTSPMQFIKKNPLGEVIIRLDEDQGDPHASFFSKGRLLDLWYYMLGPLLPSRHHTLTVQIRQKDGTYMSAPVKQVSEDGLPDWIDEFRRRRDRGLRERARLRRGGRLLHLAREPRGLGRQRRRPVVGEQGIRRARGRDRDAAT